MSGVLRPYHTVLFEETLTEETCEGYRPDLTGITKTGRVHIEIVVTNDVSEHKLEKVRESTIPMLTVDMSAYNSLQDLNSLRQAVLYEAPRQWVHHPDHREIEEQLENGLNKEITAANQRLKRVVMEQYGLTEQSSNYSNQQPLSPKPNQVIVLGYNSAYGYSRRKNRDFDISLLRVSKPISGRSSTNYTVRSSNGYEEETMVFEESLIPKLEQLRFPCIAELEVKAAVRNGSPQIVVADLKVE